MNTAPQRYRSQNDLLIASLSAAGAIGLSAVAMPLFFATNDDWIIQHMFSGALAGYPVPYVPYMGYPLCWAVSRIYYAFPGVPWWTLLHFVVIFVALAAAGLATLRILAARDICLGRVKAFILLFVAELGLAAPLIGRLHFTTTGTLAASVAVYAAVAQMLLCVNGRSKSDCPSPHIIAWPVIVLLLTLGYCYRAECGYIAMCFWLLALIVTWGMKRATVRDMFRIKAIWLPLVTCCAAVAVCGSIQAFVYSGPQWDKTFELGNRYSAFVDYPSTRYESAKDVYDSVGWDETLYQLVSNYWFILDPRVTSEALEVINDSGNQGLAQIIDSPLAALRDRTAETKKPVSVAYLGVLIVASGMVLRFCSERRGSAAVWAVLIAALALLAFLFVRGRLPFRAFFSVILPAIAVVGALALVLGGIEGRSRRMPKIGLAILSIPLVLLCVALFLMGQRFSCAVGAIAFVALWVSTSSSSLYDIKLLGKITGAALILCSGTAVTLLPAASAIHQYGYSSTESKELMSRQPNIDAFKANAYQNPDTLFIYDYWAELTPWTVWDTDWPPNVTSWGGLPYYMSWFDESMREQGFGGRPTTETLLSGKALFVNLSDTTRDLLVKDMRNLYGPDIDIEQVDTIGNGLRVYNFVQH